MISRCECRVQHKNYTSPKRIPAHGTGKLGSLRTKGRADIRTGAKPDSCLHGERSQFRPEEVGDKQIDPKPGQPDQGCSLTVCLVVAGPVVEDVSLVIEIHSPRMSNNQPRKPFPKLRSDAELSVQIAFNYSPGDGVGDGNGRPRWATNPSVKCFGPLLIDRHLPHNDSASRCHTTVPHHVPDAGPRTQDPVPPPP